MFFITLNIDMADNKHCFTRKQAEAVLLLHIVQVDTPLLLLL